MDVKQGKRVCYLTCLPAKFVVNLSYVAMRKPGAEVGAVQRMLNPARIDRIRDFTLLGGDFPNAIVLNWNHARRKLVRKDGKITISDDDKSAQIIDGQHRLAGIEAAIKTSAKIGQLQLPVVFYEGLDTSACAEIFLAINTEQKPVPRSLVYDLFGEVTSGLIDSAALRARDIAMFLHEDESSPYYGDIKLPGAPIRKGGIALSTVVNAIKAVVQDQGILYMSGVQELESQKKVLYNYFDALRRRYGEEWKLTTNAFMYSSGFVGAMQFFSNRIAPYCSMTRSFESSTIFDAILLTQRHLIHYSDVRGRSGSATAADIFERLDAVFKAAERATGAIRV
jgi:DGQHR domain-containing protein